MELKQGPQVHLKDGAPAASASAAFPLVASEAGVLDVGRLDAHPRLRVPGVAATPALRHNLLGREPGC